MPNSKSDGLNTPLLDDQSKLLKILGKEISLLNQDDLTQFIQELGDLFGRESKNFSNDVDFQRHVLEVLSKNSLQNDWAKKSKKLFIGSAFVISNATSILGYKVSPNDLDYFLKADPSIMTPAQLKMQKEIVILALCVMLIVLWFYVTKKSVLDAWLPQDAQSLGINNLSLLKGVYAVLKNKSQDNDAARIKQSLNEIISKAKVDAERSAFEQPLQQCLTAIVLLLPLTLIGVPLVPSGVMMFAGLSVLGAFMGGLVLAKSYSANLGSRGGLLFRGLIGLSSLIMPIASSMPLVIQMMGTNVSLMTAVINNPVVVIIPALSIIIGGLAALAFLKGREAFNQSNVMQNPLGSSHADQGDAEPEYGKKSVVICRALGKAFGTVNGICINSAICLGLGLGGVNGMLGLFFGSGAELQGVFSFALLGVFAVAGGYQSYRFTGDSIRSVWAQLGVWIARKNRTFDKVTAVSMGMSFLLGLALAVISSNAIIALPIFTGGGLLASSSGMVAGIVGVFTIIAVTSLFGDFFSRFLESSLNEIISKATHVERSAFEKTLKQCLTAVVLLLLLILIGVPLVPSGVMMIAGLSVLGAFMGGLVLAKSYSANLGSRGGLLFRGLIGLSSLIMLIASSMPLVIQMMGTNVSLITAVINNPLVVIIPALSIIIGGLAALAFLKGREAFKDNKIGKQIARSVAPGILSWVVGCGVGLLVMLISSFMPVISLGLGSPLIPSLGIGLAAIFLTKAVLSVDRTGNFSKQLLNIWRAFLFTCASAGAVAFGLSSFVYFSQFSIVLASAVLVVSTIVLGAFYCATSMQSDTVTVNQGQFNLDQETGGQGESMSVLNNPESASEFREKSTPTTDTVNNDLAAGDATEAQGSSQKAGVPSQGREGFSHD